MTTLDAAKCPAIKNDAAAGGDRHCYAWSRCDEDATVKFQLFSQLWDTANGRAAGLKKPET
jgi:hypothetical protein